MAAVYGRLIEAPSVDAVGKLGVHHILHEPEKNKAVIYASSTGEAPWGPWQMAYAVFITFTNDGTKIAVLEEMLDTNAFQGIGPKLEAYIQENGGPMAVAAAAAAAQ